MFHRLTASRRANGIIGDSMKKQRETGFTLVELSLAMTFLAFIMVFVVVVLIQIMNIYNKGIAMTQINQTGRQVADDLNSSVRFATPGSVTYLAANNRLCTGQVSYLWNIDGGTTNTFSDNSAIGVVRIRDSVSDYCNDVNLKPSLTNTNVTVLSGPSVGILEFTVDTAPSFIRINMVLSTSGNNKPVYSSGKWSCLGSGGSGSNPYCAFANFDNTIYMRGGQ